ncbi:MAG TPA: hypothetical protein VGM98_00400 [Schlesneria sp.]|jgi:hypothetical protein
MPSDGKSTATTTIPHNLAKALPAFDAAMRKIVSTPKAEVERREQEEKQ